LAIFASHHITVHKDARFGVFTAMKFKSWSSGLGTLLPHYMASEPRRPPREWWCL